MPKTCSTPSAFIASHNASAARMGKDCRAERK
jgi:hypothetical protein